MKYLVLIFLLTTSAALAQSQLDSLDIKIASRINAFKGKAGIAIWYPGEKGTRLVNGNKSFPMQSVYKLPIGMCVLDLVDKKKLSLDQLVSVSEKELLKDTWSPLRDSLPTGGNIPLKTLLEFTIAKSDNNGCDILLKLVGGAPVVQKYVTRIGLKNMHILSKEEEMHKDRNLQYKNDSNAQTILALLKLIYKEKVLSDESRAVLLAIMKNTRTGPKRIRGLLPAGTVVANKTGTGAENGKMAAINDVGIIYLPNGKAVLVAMMVGELTCEIEKSVEAFDACEALIANISKDVYDFYK